MIDNLGSVQSGACARSTLSDNSPSLARSHRFAQPTPRQQPTTHLSSLANPSAYLEQRSHSPLN
eukprot:4677289-Prymnesium_polylepis.1